MAANRLLRTSAWRDDDGRVVLEFSVTVEHPDGAQYGVVANRLLLTPVQALNLANKLMSAYSTGAVGGKPGEQQARTNHTPEPPAAA